ncbi:hypothetical protein RRSWK_01244 [Rhodopirellula sp. SWK7]|nr:hypothetical protein RRSWK_01244 [Rhodopirellula sp. SWK7]
MHRRGIFSPLRCVLLRPRKEESRLKAHRLPCIPFTRGGEVA